LNDVCKLLTVPTQQRDHHEMNSTLSATQKSTVVKYVI
jgi:hypothetical protein